jgi:hypothetical protein
MSHSVKELPREILGEVLQKLLEQLPGEGRLLFFCAAALLIGLLVAQSNKILINALAAASLFLVLQSTQLFISTEDIALNLLPYICGFFAAGLVLGYSKSSTPLWISVISVSMIVNAIGTPIKLVLNMDDVPLKIVAMSFILGMALDFVLLMIVAKLSRIIFRRNDT